jgi:hypothetical protein
MSICAPRGKLIHSKGAGATFADAKLVLHGGGPLRSGGFGQPVVDDDLS